MTNTNLWNRKRLSTTLDSDEKIINWGKTIGLLPLQRYCYGRRPHQHGKHEMAFYRDRKAHGEFVCTKCHASKSLMADTWFEEARMPLEKILRFDIFFFTTITMLALCTHGQMKTHMNSVNVKQFYHRQTQCLETVQSLHGK